MGHRAYGPTEFSSLATQHNIMAFVGNGFDLQALQDYQSRTNTSYTRFYESLKREHFNPSNPILLEMEKLSQTGAPNWSDVEGAVDSLLENKEISPSALLVAMREIQSRFADFLDLAAPNSLLLDIGRESGLGARALGSLNNFLADLGHEEYRALQFTRHVGNFDLYNFLFVNFNYTSLFDNFMHLGHAQFDPLPRSTVDRNFEFYGNPNNITGAHIQPGDRFSSYVITDIIHPHGHQSVPHSLLLGTDEVSRTQGQQDPALRLSKPFWSQNQRRYRHLFENTELYIIFGCSLGDSDRWWWKNIAESLGRTRQRPHCRTDCCASCDACTYTPELLLYWWHDGGERPTKDELKNRFFSAAGLPAPQNYQLNSVHVIPYGSTDSRAWLNTSRSTSPDGL